MKDGVTFLMVTKGLILSAGIIGGFIGAGVREDQIYADCVQQNNHMVVREVETMCARLVGREAE